MLCKQPKWWVRKANCITWLPQSNELHTSWPTSRRGSESGRTDHTKSFTNQNKCKGGSLLFMVWVNMVGWYKRCQNVEMLNTTDSYSNEFCMHPKYNLALFHHVRIPQSDQWISKSHLFGPYSISNTQSHAVNLSWKWNSCLWLFVSLMMWPLQETPVCKELFFSLCCGFCKKSFTSCKIYFISYNQVPWILKHIIPTITSLSTPSLSSIVISH